MLNDLGVIKGEKRQHVNKLIVTSGPFWISQFVSRLITLSFTRAYLVCGCHAWSLTFTIRLEPILTITAAAKLRKIEENSL